MLKINWKVLKIFLSFWRVVIKSSVTSGGYCSFFMFLTQSSCQAWLQSVICLKENNRWWFDKVEKWNVFTACFLLEMSFHLWMSGEWQEAECDTMHHWYEITELWSNDKLGTRTNLYNDRLLTSCQFQARFFFFCLLVFFSPKLKKGKVFQCCSLINQQEKCKMRSNWDSWH